MAYSKMNKKRHCAARLRASIRWKCKNRFTIKKVFFLKKTIMNFPHKVFRIRFNPMHGNKTINRKSQESTQGTSIRENRHTSHFGQDQRPLAPYQPTSQSTHHTIKSPAFPPQDQDHSWPTKLCHTSVLHTTKPASQ